MVATREIELFIWDTHTQKNLSCLINKDTTIQNIIDDILAADAARQYQREDTEVPPSADDILADDIKLTGVCMALLGHKDKPFQLLPCDYPKQLLQGKPDSIIRDDCLANDFNVKVLDLVMSIPENIIGMQDFISTLEIRTSDDYNKAVDFAKQMFWNIEKINEFSIHLFMYNHQEIDLCNIEGGEDGKWSKRDWKLTTNESSLWLQLEKKFLTERIKKKYDCTEATLQAL
jgi:hypothetical protein